jgi:hypothetical protein
LGAVPCLDTDYLVPLVEPGRAGYPTAWGNFGGNGSAEELEPLLGRRIHAHHLLEEGHVGRGDPSADLVDQGERRESSTHMRLDGDEMPADADDGDAGDSTRTYITQEQLR